MLACLSVCSGYGGLDIALEEYVKPIAYVEIEEYCQKIIAYRMADGSLKRAPILADIKNVRGKPGVCDILVGGTPCQNFSVAGDRKGLEGERSSLFFEFARLAREIRPSLIFWENVPGARTKGFTEVARTFTEMGYDCRWTIVSAQAVGANHRRERLFMLAHANSNINQSEKSRGDGISKTMESIVRSKNGAAWEPCGAGWYEWKSSMRRYAEADDVSNSHSSELRNESIRLTKRKSATELGNDGEKEFMADTNNKNVGLARGSKTKHSESSMRSEQKTRDSKSNHWSVEPDVGRVAHGVAFRVDRIKALGNGVVPEQARVAFEYLLSKLNKEPKGE